MVEIIGIYHIGYDYNYMLAYNEQNVLNYYAGEEFNDEYLQSVRQGYEFTYIDTYIKKMINIINITIKHYYSMKLKNYNAKKLN